ncbi:MAG: YeaH/YhbH family protein [Pseudomonadota bacterium]
MTNMIIDRRQNGPGKSVDNRRRFIRRYKEAIEKAVVDLVDQKSITDMGNGGKVRIPRKLLDEPTFRHAKGGLHEGVLPGNREYTTGDRIPRPDGGGGRGGGASDETGGEDDFVFELNRDEFLHFLFAGLALPAMVKKKLASIEEWKPKRAGWSTSGIPSQMDVVRTLRQSMGRHIALTSKERRRLAELTAEGRTDEPLEDGAQAAVAEEIHALRTRIARVPFLDPVDLRYHNRVKMPVPTTKAVVFNIMDVSGSMGQHEKDMAKRFFALLYLFLQRRYDRIDVVFIRHHAIAQEVDENEFFYSTSSGGTIVSSALSLTRRILEERYNADWNVYVCQATDGDNFIQDNETSIRLLRDLLPRVQYYAYVEIGGKTLSDLWTPYARVAEEFKHLQMKQVEGPEDIYPVFRELFSPEAA